MTTKINPPLCEFEIKFKCKKHWDDLDRTFISSKPDNLEKIDARFCHACQNNVYFAKSKNELDLITSSNNCAAFNSNLDIYFSDKFPFPQNNIINTGPTMGFIEKYNQQEKIEKIKAMISLGKDRGFLTFSEIIDHLQENIIDPEAFENIIKTLEELGINIKED